MVATPIASAIKEREAQLRGARTTFETHWQTLARYLIPDAANFTEEQTPGVERQRQILDATGPRSLELFASSIHTLLNNPAAQWLKMRPYRTGRDEPQLSAKQWAERTERAMLAELSSGEVGLYQHLHSHYLDLGAFGTAVLSLDESQGRMRVQHHHLRDCIIDESEAGSVDCMFRRRKLSHRQATQRWPGVNLGASVVPDNSRKTTFLHAVFPVGDQLAKNIEADPLFPFVSVWLNLDDCTVVEQGGFEEFPYLVSRWVKYGCEIYGRSPGMTALPDIRMANRMKESILRGAEKLVDPPLVWREGALLSPVRMFAGGITFTDGDVKPEPLIPPGASRIEVGNALLESTQQAIREAFFVPLFLTAESPVKTATQVLQEVNERNRALSPMLVRLQAELFHPLAWRALGLMRRAGRLEPLPADTQVKIEYVSPLQASQREMDALSVSRLFESLAPWSQIDQGAFDQFDVDQVGAVMAEALAAPEQIRKTPARIKALRTARDQQQQAAAQQQTQFAGADAAAKLIAASSKQRA